MIYDPKKKEYTVHIDLSDRTLFSRRNVKKARLAKQAKTKEIKEAKTKAIEKSKEQARQRARRDMKKIAKGNKEAVQQAMQNEEKSRE